jgi:nicotinate-nucleotide pyrophosphorylase
MQHLSGIATLTRQYVDAIQGTHARVLDTRKTVPGLRVLDKYAVQCGGGTNHRIDLASGILIKNNHITLGGGLPTVLTRALEHRKQASASRSRCARPQELEEALDYGAEAILLDNMTPEQVKPNPSSASKRRGQRSPRPGAPERMDPHRSLRRHRPLKTSAPTPKPASTSSASARSPTPPKPPTSP